MSTIGLVVVVLLSLVYMRVCAFWSLSELRIGGMYEFHGHHATNASSMLFNAANTCKISAALANNYLNLELLVLVQ